MLCLPDHKGALHQKIGVTLLLILKGCSDPVFLSLANTSLL